MESLEISKVINNQNFAKSKAQHFQTSVILKSQNKRPRESLINESKVAKTFDKLFISIIKKLENQKRRRFISKY